MPASNTAETHSLRFDGTELRFTDRTIIHGKLGRSVVIKDEEDDVCEVFFIENDTDFGDEVSKAFAGTSRFMQRRASWMVELARRAWTPGDHRCKGWMTA